MFSGFQEAGMWTDALRVVKEYLPHKVCTVSETITMPKLERRDQSFNQNV